MTPLHTITSPNGRVEVSFYLNDITTISTSLRRNAPQWSVTYRGHPLLLPSPLTAAIAGQPPLNSNFLLLRARRHTTLENHTLRITLQEQNGLQRTIVWHLLCSNTQVTSHFSLPRQPFLPRHSVVSGDSSIWHFPPASTITPDSTTGTAAIELPHGNVALATGWGVFQRSHSSITLTHGDSIITRFPHHSPPRRLLLGKCPADFILPYRPPMPNGITISDDTFSTSGGLHSIRCAATIGARYILYDYGWCGSTTDSSTTGLTPFPAAHLRRKYAGWSGLNITAIAHTASLHKIGLILALPWETLQRHYRVIIPTYSRWGIAAIKVGDLPSPPDAATAAQLTTIAATAASSNILLIVAAAAWYSLPDLSTTPIHITADLPTTPTSLCHLAHTHGVLGLFTPPRSHHHSATTLQRLITPFVATSPFPVIATFPCPHLPLAAQPLTTLWSELPPDNIWDETIPLRSEPDLYFVIARRSGTRWFIIAVNGSASRVHTVRLEDTLPPGTFWNLTLYRDPTSLDTPRYHGVVVETFNNLHASDKIKLEVAANSGYLLALSPATPPPAHA